MISFLISVSISQRIRVYKSGNLAFGSYSAHMADHKWENLTSSPSTQLLGNVVGLQRKRLLNAGFSCLIYCTTNKDPKLCRYALKEIWSL